MATAPSVLIVADDALWRKQLVRAVALAGYAAAAPELPAEAAALTARPAAVLLDATGALARDVARACRAGAIVIPLLLLTAEDDAEALAAELGASAVLAKPFDLADLLLLLRRHAGPPPGDLPPIAKDG